VKADGEGRKHIENPPELSGGPLRLRLQSVLSDRRKRIENSTESIEGKAQGVLTSSRNFPGCCPTEVKTEASQLSHSDMRLFVPSGLW